jgi:hypothetical protein
MRNNVPNTGQSARFEKGKDMKQIVFASLMLCAIFFLLNGCSEDQNPLPSKAHPESWNQQSAADFHGIKVKEIGFNSCKSCHGADLTGGESKISCFKCHASYPHSDSWLDRSSDEFHGQYLKKPGSKIKDCAACHGEDYAGGSSKVSCFECHAAYPHPDSWSDRESEEFHGKYLKKQGWKSKYCTACHGGDYTGGSSNVSCFMCHPGYPHGADWMKQDSGEFHAAVVQAANWSLVSCAACHGTDFEGGVSDVSCHTCHEYYPHKSEWLTKSSSDFHGNFIRMQNWSMETCKSCHGTDYTGGTTNSSCYECHTDTGGPEACNVCHGSAEGSYPPKDLSGNTETTAIGVGAHKIHMTLFHDCTICHVVPKEFSDPRHIDSTPYAEVNTAWGWDRNTASCANSCHTDPSRTYVWNGQ